MLNKSKDHAGSHSENRMRICLFCLKKKGKMIKIDGALRTKIENVIEYDHEDNRLPSVVCSACKINVYRCVNNINNKTSIKLPDYSHFRSIHKNTRSKSAKLCECSLCQLVRKPGHPNFLKSIQVSGKKTKNLTKKKCTKCLLELSRGKQHICNSSNHYNNLKEHLKNSLPPTVKEHLVCELIKDISIKKSNNTQRDVGKITLSQVHGKQLTIFVKSQQPSNLRRQQITAEDMSKIKTNFSLSSKMIRGISSAVRVATKNRKIFEVNLTQKLITLNHTLDSYFDVKNCDFVNVKNNIKNNVIETVVFCNNLKGLIEYVKRNRQLEQVHLKFGIDGGGGFLKVCLSVQSIDKSNCESEIPLRQSYNQGVAAKKFKDSGVKKLFLLGLAPCTQENYNNILTLWALLGINEFKGTVATDLKLANMLTGIMSHASSLPCTWCTALKDKLNVCGAYRTIGDCLENYDAWEKAGSNKGNAKNYKNCIYPPIISGNENTEIIDVIPPPELHLLIGVVNIIFKHMLIEFEEDSLTWAKTCCVAQEITHGTPAFAGNSCKILLDKVDVLRANCNIGCLKYVKCLKDFQDVVNSCFATVLNPKFEDYIIQFRKSYVDLKINITPKVHAVFFHVTYFCSKMHRGLGFFSEQAMESVHSDFQKTWAKYKVKSINPEYAVKLLKAVREYNSCHI